MNVARRSQTLWLAVLCSGVGCSSGVIGEPDPAAPEEDTDVESAMNALHQPLQAAFGQPLPHLRQADLELFEAGKEEFEEEETPDEGLGPVFNDTSCARCHSDPAVGGGSALLETRFGAIDGGVFDPLTQFGGSLIQVKGIGPAGSCNFAGETVPKAANVISLRRTTPLFGLGLVDAVPESTFHFVAVIESIAFPGEAGRVAMVHDIARNRDAVGRFGWKDTVPTLHQFGGDAYLNEMGVTNPEFPNETCPNGDCSLLAACNPDPELNDDGSGVVAFTDFMTMLAPPPRTSLSRQAFDGKRVFSDVGCTHCHWATFRTGGGKGSLSYTTFHPYSDFLLHDMGSLGDGIALGDARGGEFRTAPLWGISAVTLYLHDGRATTLEQAILAHDGQGRRARDRYAKLSAEDQAALIAFVSSL